jgi:DNA mismatch repair ATPase MutS
LRRKLERALEGADQAFEDIGLIEAVMERLERESFESERLKSVTARLVSDGEPCSRVMKRFGRIVEFVRSRNSLLIRTLDWPLLYSVNMAYIAERWRAKNGRAVRAWLEAIGEVEALTSVGGYTYEHAEDVFPEFVSGAGNLEARSIGHPLIAAGACVRNDVSLGDHARVLLVSGSNMSGKSTLLRTVGINVVLAMAGAPVRAEQMRLTPLQVGASIRINDSLHEASSRFYAEVKRLRAILDLAGREVPLIFLLDELLQGTNSHDRQVGAEGALKELVERGAIGLVSTHDLALTQVSGGDGWLRNVHFQDEFVGDQMRFDYKLREGVVTKSNGLELMRALGIRV